MIKVYAAVLTVGFVALLAWIGLTVLAGNLGRSTLDPESRLGIMGRRVVAGAVGFGIAGMAAEFSPLDIAWPLALLLAAAGSVAAAWYSSKVGVGIDGDGEGA